MFIEEGRVAAHQGPTRSQGDRGQMRTPCAVGPISLLFPKWITPWMDLQRQGTHVESLRIAQNLLDGLGGLRKSSCLWFAPQGQVERQVFR